MKVPAKRLIVLGTALATLSASGLALAQERGARFDNLDEETKAALLEDWESKSPAEQEEFKDRVQRNRERFNELSPEQQALVKKRREEMKSEWQTMTPEQRQVAREEMSSRRSTRRANFQDMSPEERAEMRARFEENGGRQGRGNREGRRGGDREFREGSREENRARWENASEEERAEMRRQFEDRAGARERMRDASPEERRRAVERYRNRDSDGDGN